MLNVRAAAADAQLVRRDCMSTTTYMTYIHKLSPCVRACLGVYVIYVCMHGFHVSWWLRAVCVDKHRTRWTSSSFHRLRDNEWNTLPIYSVFFGLLLCGRSFQTRLGQSRRLAGSCGVAMFKFGRRRCQLVLLLALLAVGGWCSNCVVSSSPVQTTPTNGTQFEVTEILLAADSYHSPFTLNCAAVVNGPASSRYASGRGRDAMQVPLFYDGNDTWGMRFTPDMPGSWDWNVSGCDENPSLHGSGHVVVAPNTDGYDGGVVQSATNPRALVRETGQPFQGFGMEVDWLWALPSRDAERGHGSSKHTSAPSEATTVEDVTEYFESFGFNHLLVTFYSNYSGWNAGLPARVPPKVSPALSTPWVDQTGYVLNLEFFYHWDAVFKAAQKANQVIRE